MKLEKTDFGLTTHLLMNGYSENYITELEVIFKDTENKEKPSQFQLNAFNHLSKNLDQLISIMFTEIYREREEYEEVYGPYIHEDEVGFPDLNRQEDLIDYIYPHEIYIHCEKKEETSYISLLAGCSWDHEHGFGVTFHKNDILCIGDESEAFSFYEAKEHTPLYQIHHLEYLPERRRKINELSKVINIENTAPYIELFDWLISIRGLYGYRSTKVDLTDVEKIALLKHIDSIDISCKSLESIPKDIGLLENLKYLDMSYNKIKSIPDSISKLKNLEILSISNNKLSSLNKSLFDLSQLNSLNISSNNISNIDSSISNLSKLTRLDYQKNNLESTPASISSLSSLENLDLSNNNLKELPSWIDKLENLVDLRISENTLTKLPKSIKKLKKLKRVVAMNNYFSGLQRMKIKKWLKEIDYSIQDDYRKLAQRLKDK